MYEEEEWKVKHSPDFTVQSFVPVLIVTPKTSWENLWNKLEALDILTLPDSSTLPDEWIVPDGRGYVVEINDGEQYRTYHYGSPEHQNWPETKKFMQIVKILYDELIHTLPKDEIPWYYVK